jgi:hypothetical protein
MFIKLYFPACGSLVPVIPDFPIYFGTAVRSSVLFWNRRPVVRPILEPPSGCPSYFGTAVQLSVFFLIFVKQGPEHMM